MSFMSSRNIVVININSMFVKIILYLFHSYGFRSLPCNKLIITPFDYFGNLFNSWQRSIIWSLVTRWATDGHDEYASFSFFSLNPFFSLLSFVCIIIMLYHQYILKKNWNVRDSLGWFMPLLRLLCARSIWGNLLEATFREVKYGI